MEMEQVLAVKEQWRARRKVLEDEFMALLNLESRSSLQERRFQDLILQVLFLDSTSAWHWWCRLRSVFLPFTMHTSTSCVCHRVWLGNEYGFRRPSLEREVQWDVRVHSSSCGAHRDVVHSPFEWLYHRCHCNCRGFVLFVGRRP